MTITRTQQKLLDKEIDFKRKDENDFGLNKVDYRYFYGIYVLLVF
jgi:hypothetical protein